MTDDLDDLKAALNAASPAPDATRRRENLALAQKNFEALQGSTNGARPTSVNGQNALWTGVKTMLNTLTTKGALGATTALVAGGFLFLSPIGQNLLNKGGDLTFTDAVTPLDKIETAAETAPQTPANRRDQNCSEGRHCRRPPC